MAGSLGCLPHDLSSDIPPDPPPPGSLPRSSPSPLSLATLGGLPGQGPGGRDAVGLHTGWLEGSGQGLESCGQRETRGKAGQGDRAPGPRGDSGARGLVKGRVRSTGDRGHHGSQRECEGVRSSAHSVRPSLSVLTPHFKNPADAKLPWASGLSRLGVRGQAWAPAQGLGGDWAPAQNQLAGGAACGSVAGGGVARSEPGVHWGRAAWWAPLLS